MTDDQNTKNQPNPKQFRNDYVARIHRVQDHIEAHLDEPLPLAELARVACFSAFHFHRIFSAMTGETVHGFIRRLRLEKAAAWLVSLPDAPVTDIALDVGFGSSATFARAFRAHFGMTASQWRDGGHRDRKIGKTDRNNGQPDRKPCNDTDVSAPYVGERKRNLTWRIEMKKNDNSKLTATVEVQDLPEMHVAYVRHTGPYAGDSELFKGLFERLMTWAGPRGLVGSPDTQVLCIYHDSPEITDAEKQRLSAGITVPEATEVSGEIGKLTLEAGAYAVAQFELDSTEYADAWNAVYGGWLPKSGYQPDDRPPYERYLNNPEEHPEGKCLVNICIPVRPA